jgi:hypothetical protein
MKAPASKKIAPKKPAPSKSTIAKVAVIGASAAFVTAKIVDAGLVGAGVMAAVGSAAFAGFMLMQGDHTPRVNGMEYLAIFGQPSGGSKNFAPAAPGPAPSEVASAPAAPSATAIDPAPLGAIEPAPKSAAPDYELVAAGFDHAWVRSGARILSVKPGDTIPDLGRVGAIAWNEGHWTLIGEDGKPLLAEGTASGKAVFAKPLIFGGRKAP